MAKQNLNILLLIDMSGPPPQDQDYSELLKSDAWENERHVVRALEKLGHSVKIFGVFDDIIPLVEELKSRRPDLVFNSCEAFQNDRVKEPHIAALIELFQIPITGNHSLALQLCKDKGLTKKILSHHQIRVPKFKISRKQTPLRTLKQFPYPAFIKPLGLEASEGIAQVSFAETEKACLDRVRFIHDSLNADAIIEEYIEGRELYVSILGNSKVEVFPARELFFDRVPEDEPKFASFKAKWDEDYRKKWGFRWAAAKKLPPDLEKKLPHTCKRIYRLLSMRGYGRIDLRIRNENEIYFIEANPNPSLVIDDDFASSAKMAGIPFEKLIDKIIHLALLK